MSVKVCAIIIRDRIYFHLQCLFKLKTAMTSLVKDVFTILSCCVYQLLVDVALYIHLPEVFYNIKKNCASKYVSDVCSTKKVKLPC